MSVCTRYSSTVPAWQFGPKLASPQQRLGFYPDVELASPSLPPSQLSLVSKLLAQYSQVSLMALMVVELSKDIGSISLFSGCYFLSLHLEWHCTCRDQSEMPISINTTWYMGRKGELSHSNSWYLFRTWTGRLKEAEVGTVYKSIWQHICQITNCQCWEILTRNYFYQETKRSGLVQYLSCPAVWVET